MIVLGRLFLNSRKDRRNDGFFCEMWKNLLNEIISHFRGINTIFADTSQFNFTLV